MGVTMETSQKRAICLPSQVMARHGTSNIVEIIPGPSNVVRYTNDVHYVSRDKTPLDMRRE